MINSLVEDNKGVISNYIVDKEKNLIYVMFLNGEQKVLEYTEENIEKLTTIMLNQAVKALNLRKDPKYIQSKRADMFRNAVFATFSAAALFTAIELALKDPNPVRITMEAVAMLALVPVGSFLFENKVAQEVDDNYRKYRLYLNNFRTFDIHKNKVMLYEGVEYKGDIDINTLDNYTFQEVVKIFNNLGPLTTYERERIRVEGSR